MPVPVQTSFGLALLPLPVTLGEEGYARPRGGASERAREEAFYQGFSERGSRERVPGGLSHATSPGRRLSARKVFVGLVSLAKQLSRRVSSLRWPFRGRAPFHRG
jgi:hypothetical protein